MIARRVAALGVGTALLMLAAPATAAAVDTVFDPADAQELADTLTEASQEQGVCYGWQVTVDDQYAGVDSGESIGSNFGVGQDVNSAPGADRCKTTVEFTASITYTSESSESEDFASYSVTSAPRGPTTQDLDDLEIVDEDGLVGDNVDLVVYKAVAALPLLAADTGVAKPLVATPEPVENAGNSRLTDSPGSDFLRENWNFLLWGSLLLLAGIVFGIYAIRSSRRAGSRSSVRPVGPPAEQLNGDTKSWESYPPPSWEQRYPPPGQQSTSHPPASQEPPTYPIQKQDPPEQQSDQPPDQPPSDQPPPDQPPQSGAKE